MIDLAEPKFQWGQPVQAVADLCNDGSYPDVAAEEILVRQGDTGEIVQVGTHVETNTFIYMVEFHKDRVVGCLEDEIAAVL
ncbi:nitrogen fixation protein NifZ [Telmatospirillum siberiense]|uniref:Nitrogen fixation protein NifZ n=1 Tax=Telmatospirillum siberiense TaxID=382514 RepID=A0A2N3PVW6_9PROT|nr:nitrogen fixation protein NifZ [Telmatospirillum siberiense]PKU24563.1 nitrogen fixation protein NifZ [Telmatospirillum siberiense]